MSPSKLRVGTRSATKAHARCTCFARSLVTMTIFRICQVECRRIFYFMFLSVCGLDFSAIYGSWFRVLVIGLQLAIRVGGRVACPVVVFAILNGTWFSVLVIDLHR